MKVLHINSDNEALNGTSWYIQQVCWIPVMASNLVAFLLLVAMPFVPSSFLLLVVWPGAPSSVLAPSDGLQPKSDFQCSLPHDHPLHDPLSSSARPASKPGFNAEMVPPLDARCGMGLFSQTWDARATQRR